MAESKVLIKRPNSASTPPNCAICLGSCTNKCFSDSCMHQFCFQCLLEWSRIKAECPLCKQPFKSIIHNVKSNEEYDEHVVETPRNEEVRILGNDDMWFLPLPITPHRHEFHVRTTFTVDSRGEHAIQQMLLTHPLTTGGRITVGTGYPSARGVYSGRHRRDFSASGFRRSIYEQNLWAYAQPDLTGRYRECSPAFFRNNPAARQRLTPWLNRELNALLYENTQLVMHLVDFIMEQLLTHHICSRTFRNLLREYLDVKTDHFVHEFYSFMRSPFDMIGYDRGVIYTSRPQSPAPFLEDDTVEIHDNSDDSDVVLVSASNPAEPVTINLIESNSDSDEPVMVSSSSQVPLPLPPPPIRSLTPELLPRQSSPVTLVNLPPKLRHKHKALQEKEKKRWSKKRRHGSPPRSSSSSSSSDERERESYKKYKRRKMLKKLKQRAISHIDSSASTTDVNITSSDSDTDDNKPLIDIIRQKRKKTKKTKKDRKRKISRHEDLFRVREQPKTENPAQIYPMDLTLDAPSCSRHSSGPSSYSNSRYHIELPKTRSTVELSNNGQYTSVQIETSAGLPDDDYDTSSRTKIRIVRNGHNSPQPSRDDHGCEESESSNSSTEPYRLPTVKSEIREVKQENPGPSTSKPIPLVFKREHNKWYVFGESDSSD